MNITRWFCAAWICVLCVAALSNSNVFPGAKVAGAAEPVRTLDARLHHLRREGPREWSEFPEQPDATELEIRFEAATNAAPQTLRVRQQDVKQTWTVSLNGTALGKLVNDENDMSNYFAVPTGALADGENILRIEQAARGKPVPDDIRVGNILLDPRPVDQVLNECQVELEVFEETDDASGERHVPCRITIVDQDGALQTVGASSNDHLAVRAGVVYCAHGRASFGLPAGRYTVYAGRGFEYSLDRVELNLTLGESAQQILRIRREVPTAGYVACDTHVHTLTHSGHGDATIQERMVTLAGEGIELPIATDHNAHVDYEPLARQMNVRHYFTPVVGNEVTTRVGHFNIFPTTTAARVPNAQLDQWGPIADEIFRTPDVKVSILNHARDLHSGTRPFGPSLYNAVVAEQLEGWPLRFNAMEVFNSGATQSDPLQLFHDWMGLLSRGYPITPVGSSDSHDVARHFVGQARTYIACDDSDPGSIQVSEAVQSFVQGRVMVSYGLLAELVVNDKYRSGELARLPADDRVKVTVRVLAPHWIEASQVWLFANGEKIREAAIGEADSADLPVGVKWSGSWDLERPAHDVHLVAIAVGPGIEGLYWRTAKPYQPTSPDWAPQVVGCSGAVWLDADGDGRPTPAHDYAQRLVAQADGDLAALLESLVGYDTVVAAHAAHRFQQDGGPLLGDSAEAALRGASAEARDGFLRYLRAWRETEAARAQR